MLSCRIAQLRRDLGMSQSQLAQQLHISASTMGMYEQGRRMPSIDILVEMARVFGVSLDYLITGAEFSWSGVSARESNIIYACPCHRCRCINN